VPKEKAKDDNKEKTAKASAFTLLAIKPKFAIRQAIR
jgi:hypothetical protein